MAEHVAAQTFAPCAQDTLNSCWSSHRCIIIPSIFLEEQALLAGADGTPVGFPGMPPCVFNVRQPYAI